TGTELSRHRISDSTVSAASFHPYYYVSSPSPPMVAVTYGERPRGAERSRHDEGKDDSDGDGNDENSGEVSSWVDGGGTSSAALPATGVAVLLLGEVGTVDASDMAGPVGDETAAPGAIQPASGNDKGGSELEEGELATADEQDAVGDSGVAGTRSSTYDVPAQEAAGYNSCPEAAEVVPSAAGTVTGEFAGVL
ncbi:hypothetical protein HK405_001816, partial [Cladochytrium tenue]